MLATGGSLVQAVGALREAGVPEQAIVIASLVAAPEGIERVSASTSDPHHTAVCLPVHAPPSNAPPLA
jgi:uracil phosphoribosyltransferase